MRCEAWANCMVPSSRLMNGQQIDGVIPFITPGVGEMLASP